MSSNIEIFVSLLRSYKEVSTLARENRSKIESCLVVKNHQGSSIKSKFL